MISHLHCRTSKCILHFCAMFWSYFAIINLHLFSLNASKWQQWTCRPTQTCIGVSVTCWVHMKKVTETSLSYHVNTSWQWYMCILWLLLFIFYPFSLYFVCISSHLSVSHQSAANHYHFINCSKVQVHPLSIKIQSSLLKYYICQQMNKPINWQNCALKVAPLHPVLNVWSPCRQSPSMAGTLAV